MKKIILNAIPFGYGPVSKAVAIAKEISQLMDVEWQLLGTGISLEFMTREGLNAKVIETDPSESITITASKLANDADAALILMDNEWANALSDKMPVFFADSLGFMWDKKDFADYPNMNKMKRYYVQDIFGAFENMHKTGIKNLSAVPAIIDTKSELKSETQGREIVHLGGLFNPMSSYATHTYVRGMREIFSEMTMEKPLGLMSQKAIDAFPELSIDFEVASLPHAQSLGAMKASSFVWSSPGLTTLLEMAEGGVNIAPLPPQNYSQALNLRNMVQYHGKDLHEIWHFLAREYEEIMPGMPEELGVKKITLLNLKKLTDSNFKEAYLKYARDAIKQGSKLPKSMSTHENNGAKTIAKDFSNFFLS